MLRVNRRKGVLALLASFRGAALRLGSGAKSPTFHQGGKSLTPGERGEYISKASRVAAFATNPNFQRALWPSPGGPTTFAVTLRSQIAPRESAVREYSFGTGRRTRPLSRDLRRA